MKISIKNFLLIFVLLYSTKIFAGGVNCAAIYTLGTPYVNMGSINPYNYSNVVITVALAIQCTGGNNNPEAVSYVYTFDGGSSGNMTARKMYNGSNYFNYSICTSSSCVEYYGNGTGGTISVANSYNMNPSTGHTDNYTVYFVGPVQPLSVPGTYTDTINVVNTVTYQ